MDDKPDAIETDSPEAAETSPEAEPAEVSPAASSKPMVTFRGNSYDLTAVVAVTIGGVVLLTCATCNLGYYCLPFVPIILGIIGLVAAKDAVDPDRTKLLSWISVGTGTVIMGLIFLAMLAYIGFIIFAISLDSGGF